MFESILSSTQNSIAALDTKTALITIGAALLVGLLFGIGYYFVSRKNGASNPLIVTLVILPTIVAVMIFIIGSNIATAFTLAGVSTLVRFRSVPGDSKDISFIFLAMTSGLAIGMGYITYSFFFSVIILAVIFFASLFADAAVKSESKVLRITIPENLNFQNAFNDLFEKYTRSAQLDKIKTVNLGTLFELTYKLSMNPGADEKEFIDQLRTRNGNLNIMLSLAETKVDKL